MKRLMMAFFVTTRTAANAAVRRGIRELKSYADGSQAYEFEPTLQHPRGLYYLYRLIRSLGFSEINEGHQ